MNAIKNITIGHTERLYKPVGYTMLANLVNIVPFCLSIEAIRIIFNAFDGSGQPLDTTRLWWIFGVMAIYMLVMVLAARAGSSACWKVARLGTCPASIWLRMRRGTEIRARRAAKRRTRRHCAGTTACISRWRENGRLRRTDR